MNWKGISSGILVTAAVASTLAVGAGARSRDDQGGSVDPRLEGSWRVVVTPGDQPVGYFRETFSRGGGYMNSGATDAPNGDSTSHGTWVKTGPDEITVTHERFISFNPITRKPGVRKITEVLVLDGDTYSGTGYLWFCGVQGDG